MYPSLSRRQWKLSDLIYMKEKTGSGSLKWNYINRAEKSICLICFWYTVRLNCGQLYIWDTSLLKFIKENEASCKFNNIGTLIGTYLQCNLSTGKKKNPEPVAIYPTKVHQELCHFIIGVQWLKYKADNYILYPLYVALISNSCPGLTGKSSEHLVIALIVAFHQIAAYVCVNLYPNNICEVMYWCWMRKPGLHKHSSSCHKCSLGLRSELCAGHSSSSH